MLEFQRDVEILNALLQAFAGADKFFEAAGKHLRSEGGIFLREQLKSKHSKDLAVAAARSEQERCVEHVKLAKASRKRFLAAERLLKKDAGSLTALDLNVLLLFVHETMERDAELVLDFKADVAPGRYQVVPFSEQFDFVANLRARAVPPGLLASAPVQVTWLGAPDANVSNVFVAPSKRMLATSGSILIATLDPFNPQTRKVELPARKERGKPFAFEYKNRIYYSWWRHDALYSFPADSAGPDESNLQTHLLRGPDGDDSAFRFRNLCVPLLDRVARHGEVLFLDDVARARNPSALVRFDLETNRCEVMPHGMFSDIIGLFGEEIPGMLCMAKRDNDIVSILADGTTRPVATSGFRNPVGALLAPGAAPTPDALREGAFTMLNKAGHVSAGDGRQKLSSYMPQPCDAKTPGFPAPSSGNVLVRIFCNVFVFPHTMRGAEGWYAVRVRAE